VLLTQFARSVTVTPQYARGRHFITAYCTKTSSYEVKLNALCFNLFMNEKPISLDILSAAF